MSLVREHVKINTAPTVQITFTVDELRAVFHEIIGKGSLRGAWDKLSYAESELKRLGHDLRALN